MRRLIASCSVTFAIGLSGCAQSPPSVHSSQLGKEVAVIGRLGAPLGQMIKIAGEVAGKDVTRSKSQESVPLFWVRAVDGMSLKEPVLVELQFFSFQQQPKLEPGQYCVFRGYQDGGFRGIPTGAVRMMSPIPATQNWYFHESFQVLMDERRTPKE